MQSEDECASAARCHRCGAASEGNVRRRWGELAGGRLPHNLARGAFGQGCRRELANPASRDRFGPPSRRLAGALLFAVHSTGTPSSGQSRWPVAPSPAPASTRR